jgi:tetratricopeptide (TPR) repeat protein
MGRLHYLYLSQGKLDDSIEQVRKIIELSRKMSDRRLESDKSARLGYLQLYSGNPQEALISFERAWDAAVEAQHSGYKRDALLYKGFAYIEMNSLEDALKVAKELKALIERGLNKKLLRYYYYLLGRIEFKKEDYKRSIEFFKQALSLIPFKDVAVRTPAYLIEPLARAYYKSGDLKKALEEYEKITALTNGRMWWGDLYVKSFYMRGKIYEQQIQKTKAIEHYEKFLELWQNADPGFAEVEDAKKSLNALKSQH